MEFFEKLVAIQTDLKAPKGQKNTFGGYKYRSCEDILEAVKPLLAREGLVLNISDEVLEIGGRVYVKAKARTDRTSRHPPLPPEKRRPRRAWIRHRSREHLVLTRESTL